MSTGDRSSSFPHFLDFPLSMRVAYSLTLLTLAVGYLFAMIHTFSSHAGRDGNPMLSVDDLIIAYSGSKQDTELEAALKGAMAAMLPQEEAATIIAWVRSDPSRAQFDEVIMPIFEQRCLRCHDGSNPHIPELTNFAKTMQTVQLDTGMDVFTLVRVSHIHLFGLTFIFFLVTMIFVHAHLRPAWIKCTIIAIPFLAILADILSWYLTKIFAPFAWVVLISGALMGISFLAMVLISVYQMWLYKPAAKPVVD